MVVDILPQVAVLLIGLGILAKTSEVVISSAVKLSHLTKLSELAVGFVLLSVLTTLPELSVSLFSIESGQMGIAMGNILGSNIANIALVIGLAAMIGKVVIKRSDFKKLSTMLFFTSIIPLVLLMVTNLSKHIGVLLLLTYVGFIAYSLKYKVVVRGSLEEAPEDKNKYTRYIVKSFIILIIAMVGVLASSKMVVDAASYIISGMGIAQSLIGATVIAIGTSLPELSVMISAMKRGHVALTIGNVLGANMTNISLNLGAVLVLSTVAVNISVFSTLVFFSIITSMIAWYFMEREKLSKTEGIILFCIYMLFLMSMFGVELAIL